MPCYRIMSWFCYESRQVISMSSWHLASTLHSWVTSYHTSHDTDMRDNCQMPADHSAFRKPNQHQPVANVQTYHEFARPVNSVEINWSIVNLLFNIQSALCSYLNVSVFIPFGVHLMNCVNVPVRWPSWNVGSVAWTRVQLCCELPVAVAGDRAESTVLQTSAYWRLHSAMCRWQARWTCVLSGSLPRIVSVGVTVA